MTVTADIPQSQVEGEDLFPTDDEGQKELVQWVNHRFIESKNAKAQHQERWDKFYKMYRSYVKKRAAGDWRSRVWMPIAFYIIESITPRLVAQLPKFTVQPVGPEDAVGAQELEDLLAWAADKSDLYLELVKALKSSLMYGTGILKTLYDEKTAYQIKREQMMQVDTAGAPMGTDLDGQPIMQQVNTGQSPTGEVRVTRTPYLAYQGPVAEAVDISNFYVDPMADSMDAARYVIQRVFRDREHMEKMFEQGVYKKPPEDIWQTFLTNSPAIRRQASVDLGGGNGPTSQDRMLYQLFECWTDEKVVTTAGSGDYGGILLRAERNPFAHGEKPFVRIVDHLVPHEFWGIGELEPLEGLQDVLNGLWNSRIDNVKLVLNSMFIAVQDYMVDMADLQVRPGGVIRVREGIPMDQAVSRFELGEITQSAYTEAGEIERMTEKVTGVSAYTGGSSDTGSLNRTATGVAMITEQGGNRFAHKTRIAELTGFRRLGRHFGSILQQFMPETMVLRMEGPAGAQQWQTITADSIGGRFDYDIEAESSTQTESVRREQALSLFQMLAADPYSKPLKIREDVLRTFGKKDIQDYILTEQELGMMQQAQAAAPPAPEDAAGGQAPPPAQ